MKLTRRQLILGAGALALLLIIGIGTAYALYRRRHPVLSPEEAFKAAQASAELREYGKAAWLFDQALRAEPQNAAYQWAAAENARFRGDRDGARRYAQAAWDGGLQKAEVLLVLDETSTFNSSDER